MKKTKKLTTLLSILLICVLMTACGENLSGRTDSSRKLSEEDAVTELEALLTKVSVKNIEAELDIDGDSEVNTLADELPDINTYDMVVNGNGTIDIEIFSSTEKASDNETDRWLIDMAEKFNSSNYEINGKSVTVSIRSIASGTATDYIVSGKYTPDAFSPSNELWGEMVKSENITLTEVSSRLAGNTAGILLTAEAYNELKENSGEVTLESVVDEAIKGNLLLGYTNPYVSSAGLNVLVSMLQKFDSSDPFSDSATAKLEELQANIPSVAYTTAQMRQTASKGLLDAMVMEYQAYINSSDLSDYEFVPFGVRHDSPLYAVGDASEETIQGLEKFAEYCQSDDAQKAASDYGFNGTDDYQQEDNQYSGEELYRAQELWKEKKDAGQPVVAVFVADISGSMLGTPMSELQSSLINASKYIGDNNYVGLVTYNSEVYINLEIGQFNNKQRAGFTGSVKSLSAAGGTATYDAALVACDMLLKAKDDIPNAKLMIFVLSDGEQADGYSYSKVEDVVYNLKNVFNSQL
ncbi:MAG: substrate-binding domain-containing protein [Suipraeoptans sp.]